MSLKVWSFSLQRSRKHRCHDRAAEIFLRQKACKSKKVLAKRLRLQ